MQKKGFFTESFSLKDKVAIVTGGVGILGTYFCEALADCGAKVAVVDLDQNECDKFAKQLNEHYGINCLGVACDVSNRDSVIKMVDSVSKKLGDIDILHNNAASKSSDLNAFFESFENYSLEQWREITKVNIEGMFLVAQQVGKKMIEHGRVGSIIQTGSIYGLVSPDKRIYKGSYYFDREISSPAVYTVSKASVIGLTKYLACYWAEKNIRVNTLTPGGVFSGQNETFIKNYSNRVPMNRMAEKHEMASALIFLASEASSYITGQNIVIDGGLSVW